MPRISSLILDNSWMWILAAHLIVYTLQVPVLMLDLQLIFYISVLVTAPSGDPIEGITPSYNSVANIAMVDYYEPIHPGSLMSNPCPTESYSCLCRWLHFAVHQRLEPASEPQGKGFPLPFLAYPPPLASKTWIAYPGKHLVISNLVATKNYSSPTY